MSKYKRCIPCSGSGKVMGGGCIPADCDECEGKGKVLIPDDDIDYLEMKTTDSYKKAIENIKEKGVTEKDAEEIFETEFKKIDLKEKGNKSHAKEKKHDN